MCEMYILTFSKHRLKQQYCVAFLCDFMYNIPDLAVSSISKYYLSHFTFLVRTDINLLQIQIFC